MDRNYGKLTEKAVNNHKHFNTCSGSVLAAFCDKIGIDETSAKLIAKPYAGGRMGKCGAVMAAEYVLQEYYKDDAPAKIAEFEEKFMAADKGSIMCKDLRGNCRACVTDSAGILEQMFESEG